MSVINMLACSLGRRDEVPNQELAKKIVGSRDKKAVKKLVENLGNKDKNVHSDCIKVLYEIGERKPDLIADYDKDFLALLGHKNNRMVWGGMTALDYIASVNPKGIYKHLSKILDAANKGSVIAKDHSVNILIKLAADKAYTDTALTLLLDQLKTCAVNQLPMYAERAIPAISDKYKVKYVKVLSSRLPEIEKESAHRRMGKVIKKLNQ